jgi:dihydroorotate dehydrogenase
MRRAGADLVEVYTGLVYRGAALLKELTSLD